MRTNTAPLKTQIWRDVRAYVAHRASFRCEHCYQFLGLNGQCDHIIPRRDIPLLGIGMHDPTNLQYLCQSCHSVKSNGERWQGHERKGPKPRTRTRVSGRDQFLNAAGIAETPMERN